MKIFQKVHCSAYLKKINDGVYLKCERETGDGNFKWTTPVEGIRWRDRIKVTAIKHEYTDRGCEVTELADLSDFEGNCVFKRYRERVEEDFDGFLVGITYITTTGTIGTDMTMMPCNMDGDLEEIYHITRETKREKVGVVYFKNNAKRYVLMDDIKEKS